MATVNTIVGDDGSNTLSGTADRDLIYGFDPNGPQANVTSIAATRVASGLDTPLFVTAPPGDTAGGRSVGGSCAALVSARH